MRQTTTRGATDYACRESFFRNSQVAFRDAIARRDVVGCAPGAWMYMHSTYCDEDLSSWVDVFKHIDTREYVTVR